MYKYHVLQLEILNWLKKITKSVLMLMVSFFCFVIWDVITFRLWQQEQALTRIGIISHYLLVAVSNCLMVGSPIQHHHIIRHSIISINCINHQTLKIVHPCSPAQKQKKSALKMQQNLWSLQNCKLSKLAEPDNCNCHSDRINAT